MRVPSALALVALVVLAGCAAPLTASNDATTTRPTTTAASTTDDGTGTTAMPTPPPTGTTGSGAGDGDDGNRTDFADPDEDVLGWENGYWHDESIDVNQSDGLTDAELDRYVARAMARVEYVRRLEFEAEVPVRAISREEYRSGNTFARGSASYAAWLNQVWEAQFVVDEGTDAAAERAELYDSAVLGFYTPSTDRLVVVSDTPGSPVVDNATLVHELTHALQDQQFDLTSPEYGARTQDADLAANGLTEGEASYVEDRYARRCGEEWDCVSSPATGGGGAAGVNLGLLLTVLQPYSDGPVFVDRLVDREGWQAVNELHERPPASTEQIIHPGTTERPADLDFGPYARDGWRRFDQGDRGGQTVGEAGIAVMFWYQRTHYRIDVAEVGDIFNASGPFDQYNYDLPPSSGWGNDRLVPYRNGDRRGYVWVTEWDTPADAREFHDAYRQVLAGHGGEQRGESTWVVPDGGYADAFHVVRDGTTVTVVNGPTVDDLDDLRPGIDVEAAGASGGDDE